MTRPPLPMLFSITVVGVLANTLVQPVIPDILETFDQPESRAGVLVASSPFPGIVLAPVIGVLADRFGRRNVLFPCLVLFGLGGLLAATASSFRALLVARVVQGVGGAGLINLVVVLIGDHWTGIERTKQIGRNSAAVTTCIAIAPLASGIIAELSSWRWSLGLTAIALPLSLVVLLALEDRRPAEPRTLSDQLDGAARAIRQPEIVTTLVTGMLLFVVIFGVFLTALPVHLEEKFGYGPGLRGAILSTPALGSTLVSFNLGRIRNRSAARVVVTGASICIAVAALGVGLAPIGALIVVGAVIYGLGEGALIPSLQDLAASAAPDNQRGSVMAAWVSAIRLGQTIGPLAAAATFSATSTTLTMVFGAAIFAVVAMMLTVAPLGST